jgi:2'-5' RNA ligase
VTIRAFFALDPAEAALDHAERVMKALARARGAPPHVRWVRRATLHLTLAFLGDVAPDVAATLGREALASCPAEPPRIALRGVGAFPRPRDARVLVLDVEDDGALSRMASALAALAEGAGIPRETRPYRPHLTLARFRAPVDLRAWLAAAPAEPFDAPAAAFALYESRQGPDGSVYVPIARRAWDGVTGSPGSPAPT